MGNVIESAAIHERLDRQYRLLSLEFEELQPALEHMRGRFAEVIGERQLSDRGEMRQLCIELDELVRSLLPHRGSNEKGPIMLGTQEVPARIAGNLRRRINDTRRKIAEHLQVEAGWRRDWINRMRSRASARGGRDIGQDPDAHTDQEVLAEITDAEKRAYRSLVLDWKLPMGLIYQLLSDLHPGRFRKADEEGMSELAECIGRSTEQRAPLAIHDLPPQVLTHPDVAWFRNILFNAKRDQLFPQFADHGAESVWEVLEQEMLELDERERQLLAGTAGDDKAMLEIRQEHALKRRMINAQSWYFIEAEGLPPAPSLRKEIRGRAFPDLQQKVAAFDTLEFGGRMFNAGKVGSGKTGAIIYTIMLALQQGKIKKVTIQCPACILGEWRLALSDDPNAGYFNEGMALPDIVFIDGGPEERPTQWEASKDATIVVMGIEQARNSTLGALHKDLLKERGADFYVLDEAHRAKNSDKAADVIESRNSDTSENGDSEQEGVVEQRKTDMSIVYEVGSASPYRILSSATVMTNTRMDLVAATLMMNAEPEAYHCHATPPPHRLIAFDAFIQRHGLSRDQEILETLPKDTSTRRLCLSWDDRSMLRRDIALGGRECPRRFLPFLYRPPKEACIPVPSFPEPTVEIVPLSPVEEGICESVRDNDQLSAFNKIGMLIRASTHPYGVNGRPETGASVLRRTRQWIDHFFEKGVRHIVVASPIYTQGMTQDMNGYPHSSVFSALQQSYGNDGVEVTALDGKESRHTLMRTPSPISGRMLTKTQRLIETFAHTNHGIQVLQKDTVGIGINEYARAGIGHVILLGYGWTQAEIEQFLGRFARPGQTNEVCFVILLPNGICTAMYRQAGRKSLRNEIYLSGQIPTEEDLRLFDEKPSKQPISICTKTDREQFKDLCALMAGRGRQFIETGEFADLFVELYNRNWEESFNGNVLRAIGGITMRRIDRMREERRKKRGGSTLSDELITIADDGAGTFGFHRTMLHVPGIVVYTSDLEGKMIAEPLGQAILGEHYCPEHVKRCAVDETGYPDHSKNIRITSLVLDCLKHAERPRRWGREMIRTFLESNRILTEESETEVPGEWCITLTTNVFRDQRRKRMFCDVFPFFGFRIIEEASGKAVCEQRDEGEDPFEVYVFTVQRISQPCVSEQTPWDELPPAVRDGLDLRPKKAHKGAGKSTKKTKTPKPQKDGHGAYYDRFRLEPLSGSGAQTVEYTADPNHNERKEALRTKRDILRRCTDPVKVILRQHPSIDAIPDEIWLQMRLDDILVSAEDVGQTPKAVRDAFATAIVRNIQTSGLTAAVRATQISHEQQKGCLAYVEDSGGKYLIFGNAQGNTSGDKYFIERTGNGRNGRGGSGQKS